MKPSVLGAIFAIMKIRSLIRVLGAAAFAGIVLGICFTSCSKSEDLDIYGIWQEKEFAKYNAIINDTVIWDSVRHPSNSQHRLQIECSHQIDSGNFTKGGDFFITIVAVHDSSYRNPVRTAYREYVKGTYLLDTKNHKIRMEGYYMDSSFTNVATDTDPNYQGSVGKYSVQSDYYINDKFFTLSLNDSTRSDINTFYPYQLYTKCL